MAREYVTLKLDKRVADAYAAKHAESASLLSWRQAVCELIIREAGMVGAPMPYAGPKGDQSAVFVTSKPVQPPTPAPAQPDTSEDKDKRWIVRKDWSWEKDGPQLQRIMDDCNKARKEQGKVLLTRESMLAEINQ